MRKQVVSSIYSHQRSAHVVWKVQVTFQETSGEDEAKVQIGAKEAGVASTAW